VGKKNKRKKEGDATLLVASQVLPRLGLRADPAIRAKSPKHSMRSEETRQTTTRGHKPKNDSTRAAGSAEVLGNRHRLTGVAS
jgi:hypothetical protein